jgi:alpha-1,2-mannosyltransferase
MTFAMLMYTSVLSISRVLALWHYYHAPQSVIFALESTELPRVLNVTGLLAASAPVSERRRVEEQDKPRIDLRPVAQLGLRLCMGKEWHRFPGHYLVPDGVDVRFIKSEFAGLVPGRYLEHAPGGIDLRLGGPLDRSLGTRMVPSGMNDMNLEQPAHYVSCHLSPFQRPVLTCRSGGH